MNDITTILTIVNFILNICLVVFAFIIYHDIDYMSYICRRDLNDINNKLYEEEQNDD